MKKFIMLVTFVMMSLGLQAQTDSARAAVATQEGNFTVGLNTTSLGFISVENSKSVNVNVGAQLGYFVADRSALVFGLGYDTTLTKNYPDTNNWGYLVGFKHYLGNKFPIQVDYNGSVGSNVNPNTSYLGAEIGYAWFVSEKFSVEPKVRYNTSLRSEYPNVFSGGIGFNYFW